MLKVWWDCEKEVHVTNELYTSERLVQVYMDPKNSKFVQSSMKLKQSLRTPEQPPLRHLVASRNTPSTQQDFSPMT